MLLPSTARLHVHLDALVCSDSALLSRRVTDLGMEPTPFAQDHPVGRAHYEPTGGHFTAHFSDPGDGPHLWKPLKALVDEWGKTFPNDKLYAEIETIEDRSELVGTLTEHRFVFPDFRPISATLTNLPRFEAHIRLDSESVSYRLAEVLMNELAWFAAYVDIDGKRYLVLTRHGSERAPVESFYRGTIDYLSPYGVIGDAKLEIKTFHLRNVSFEELAPAIVGIQHYS